MFYRGMDRAALDAAYNNTAAVGIPKRDQYVAGWSARSEMLRKTREAKIDLRYGHEARQRLDVFSCGKTGAPILAYIHGGYWQMNDKEPHAFIGEAPLAAGFHFALIEYTLAPAVRLDQIVAEIKTAVTWLIDHATEVDGDARRVFVAGHSAGGHLTAAAMDEPRLAGGLAISGIYDLEPIRLNYLNDKLRLDEAEARRIVGRHEHGIGLARLGAPVRRVRRPHGDLRQDRPRRRGLGPRHAGPHHGDPRRARGLRLRRGQVKQST